MNLFTLMLLIALNASAEVKPTMQEFFGLTNKLSPYLTDKEQFMSDKNDKEIGKVLTEFVQNTKKFKQDKMVQSDDMKFRARLLGEGLDLAEQSFRGGQKDYSFWVLRATLNNCFSCHTQKGLGATSYTPDKNTHSDYARAEFLFLVRNYDEAIPLFVDLLSGYPKNKMSVENLESSAQKLLFYLMRVSSDDLKSIALFDKVLKNEQLPQSLQTDILAWRKYLNVKKYRIEPVIKINSSARLDAFMKSRSRIADSFRLSNQRSIADLDTTRFLYRLLEQPSSQSFRPSVLYWLAFVEKDYRLSMFDMSAENFLIECIERYPNDPAAKKCFKAYKEMQVASFTGSRGTELPPDVVKKLNKYEVLVNK